MSGRESQPLLVSSAGATGGRAGLPSSPTPGQYPKWTVACHNCGEVSGSGLTERSRFRARAGALTLLLLAGKEAPEAVRGALAWLDAAMFDPDFDPDAAEWHTAQDEDPRVPEILVGELHELRFVTRVLAVWLRESPTGPLRIHEEEGLLAIGALTGGWCSTVVHALSGAALTVEEVEEATGAANREELEARLAALEDAGLTELLEGPAGEVRHAATPWLRRGIAPLAAAARRECRMRSRDSAPPDVLDVGAAFLLTLPPVELPADLSGACRFGVSIPRDGRQAPGNGPGMAGATVHVENGHVVAVDLDLDPSPQGWATGHPLGWLDTVVDPSAEGIEIGGDDTHLAEALIEGLHEELFGDSIVFGDGRLGG